MSIAGAMRSTAHRQAQAPQLDRSYINRVTRRRLPTRVQCTAKPTAKAKPSAAKAKPSTAKATASPQKHGGYDSFSSSVPPECVLEIPDLRQHLIARPSPFAADNNRGGGCGIHQLPVISRVQHCGRMPGLRVAVSIDATRMRVHPGTANIAQDHRCICLTPCASYFPVFAIVMSDTHSIGMRPLLCSSCEACKIACICL